MADSLIPPRKPSRAALYAAAQSLKALSEYCAQPEAIGWASHECAASVERTIAFLEYCMDNYQTAELVPPAGR